MEDHYRQERREARCVVTPRQRVVAEKEELTRARAFSLFCHYILSLPCHQAQPLLHLMQPMLPGQHCLAIAQDSSSQSRNPPSSFMKKRGRREEALRDAYQERRWNTGERCPMSKVRRDRRESMQRFLLSLTQSRPGINSGTSEVKGPPRLVRSPRFPLLPWSTPTSHADMHHCSQSCLGSSVASPCRLMTSSCQPSALLMEA